jgi:hypothetical protein
MKKSFIGRALPFLCGGKKILALEYSKLTLPLS